MIEVDELAKHYGDVRAVDGISFTVAAGEMLGFLGHNGAGQDHHGPHADRARPPTRADGRAWPASTSFANASRCKPLINLVFEEQNLYERLSGRENLALFAKLYGRRRHVSASSSSSWASPRPRRAG